MSSLPIDYAPNKPLMRRYRTWIWRAIVIFTILALIWLGRPFVAQARYLAHQKQCLAHQIPRDGVAFEADLFHMDNNSTAAHLVGQNPDYVLSPAHLLEALDPRNRKRLYRFAAYFPKALRRACPQERELSEGIVFLHARRAPAGIERLVVVGLMCIQDQDGHAFLQIGSGHSYRPASFRPGDRATIDQFGGDSASVSLGSDACRVFRIFFGRSDPVDESHFAIDFEMDDGASLAPETKPSEVRLIRGTLDGWLRNSGRVVLRMRDGELKKRHGDIWTNWPDDTN